MIGDALVDALVPPADQREPAAGRELLRQLLIETATTRRQQQQRPGRLHGLDRREHGLRRHHHPGTAAERLVVDAPVPVGRERARVV